jgi:hypothetical protein
MMLHKNKIVLYTAPLDERALVLVDQLRHQRRQPAREHLGYELSKALN